MHIARQKPDFKKKKEIIMDSQKILEYLGNVSNNSLMHNFTLHLITLGLLLIYIFSMKAKWRTTAMNCIVAVLTLSVTATAFINGNYFHVLTFLILSVISVIELFIRKNEYAQFKLNFTTVISFAFILIGLWYPEFVTVSKLKCLLFSPVGIVPCPTILVILGITSLKKSKTNSLQQITVLTLGLIYGIIGTFKLRVYLDITLIAGIIFAFIMFISRDFKSGRK